MGSNKKHKKHKSERREKYEDRQFCLERPPSLKLILRVGRDNSSTPEHGSNDSPVYGVQPENLGLALDYPERHKKSKKKKKKKKKEKKHKHKERSRSRDDLDNIGYDDSSQEQMSVNDDSMQFNQENSNSMNFGSFDVNSLSSTQLLHPLQPLSIKSPDAEPFTPPSVPQHCEPSPGLSSVKSDSMKSPSSTSDASSREPRTCVLKMKQSKTPLTKLLDHLLRALEKKDPHQFFAWPVTDDIAPGYSSIISQPMDFLTIRQKVEENQYTSLQEFVDDFKLMCENAIKYNHVDTVYHKAAKRLLHTGGKMLQPENLMRSMKPLLNYMRDLTQKELGFDLTQSEETDSHIVDSGDEAMSTGAEELTPAQQEEEEKRKAIRSENDPKSRFEPFVDDLTAEEVLQQVQNAAKLAQQKIKRKKPSKMGFLRYNKDGTTSMQILVDTENSCAERVISIGAFTGKLQQGTGQIQGFREDRRNNARIVKPLNYGTFCSFAPIYDSRFSNLSKEETDLVLNTYGDDTGSEYAASILEFSKDSHSASILANSLLDFLTNGEHRKTMALLTENARQKYETYEVEKKFPNPPNEDDIKQYENVKIDFDSLRSLGDIGVEVSFLNELEENMHVLEFQKKLQAELDNNSSLLQQLHKVQNDRLSQTLPAHLAHVPHPNSDEIELASQITTNLTEIAKQLPPESIVAPHALRKAMGMTNVGLEPIVTAQQQQQLQQQQQYPLSDIDDILLGSNDLTIDNVLKATGLDTDTNIIPMELEQDSSIHFDSGTSLSKPFVLNAPHVDLESELREFLEAENNSLSGMDDVGIEQILMG